MGGGGGGAGGRRRGKVMAGGRGGPCRLSRRAWMKQVIVIGFPLGLASRDFNSLGGLFLIWRRYKVREQRGADRIVPFFLRLFSFRVVGGGGGRG